MSCTPARLTSVSVTRSRPSVSLLSMLDQTRSTWTLGWLYVRHLVARVTATCCCLSASRSPARRTPRAASLGPRVGIDLDALEGLIVSLLDVFGRQVHSEVRSLQGPPVEDETQFFVRLPIARHLCVPFSSTEQDAPNIILHVSA